MSSNDSVLSAGRKKNSASWCKLIDICKTSSSEAGLPKGYITHQHVAQTSLLLTNTLTSVERKIDASSRFHQFSISLKSNITVALPPGLAFSITASHLFLCACRILMSRLCAARRKVQSLTQHIHHCESCDLVSTILHLGCGTRAGLCARPITLTLEGYTVHGNPATVEM